MLENLEREYFTVHQLAEYSQIGPKVIYAAIQNRELTHLKVGSQKAIIKKADFEAWFDSKSKKALITELKPAGPARKSRYSLE